jgi:non-heme chloroperoxidase
MAAVPPMMLKTPSNPGGLPIEVFDGLRTSLAANRAMASAIRRDSVKSMC